MRGARAVLVLSLAFSACDPIRVISVPLRSPGKPETGCALSVFQASPDLQGTGLTRDGDVYAVLVVPSGLSSPEPRPEVSIYATPDHSSASEFSLEMRWVGTKATSDYQAFAKGALSRLAEELSSHCGHQAGPAT